MHALRWKMFLLTMLLIFVGCTYDAGKSGAPAGLPTYTYEIKHTYPHDVSAFTQGLIFRDGILWESTGLNGESSLRKVELATGRVLKKIDVPQQFFAEGMTVFRNRVYQLTWQTQKGFIYDPETFQQQGELAYTGEGWGLTHDADSLIMSDGTNSIRFIVTTTIATKRKISITNYGQPMHAR